MTPEWVSFLFSGISLAGFVMLFVLDIVEQLRCRKSRGGLMVLRSRMSHQWIGIGTPDRMTRLLIPLARPSFELCPRHQGRHVLGPRSE